MHLPAHAGRPVIELDSLPKRHPTIGDSLLNMFGAQAVLRLALDPVRIPSGVEQREVTVDRLSPPTPGTPSVGVREIGWGNLPLYSEEYLIHVSRTANERDITEKAAIVVMFLLIHELEDVTVHEVLPIGSGGDYSASLKWNP
jgi:hypothetical protein